MKKLVFFTQRVDMIPAYGERRDAADREIPVFLRECGVLPVPVPNHPDIVEELLARLGPEGIFLSGGNDLAKYGGNAPERDNTESILLNFAIQQRMPVFGICRGFQFIADYFGIPLETIEGHIGKPHSVTGTIERKTVNSFHRFGIRRIEKPLVALGFAPDGTVEALRHEVLPIMAVAWHPERSERFEKDVALVKKIFSENEVSVCAQSF